LFLLSVIVFCILIYQFKLLDRLLSFNVDSVGYIPENYTFQKRILENQNEIHKFIKVKSF